jgi:formylglycine-generating enzyme required for sulfatase activity
VVGSGINQANYRFNNSVYSVTQSGTSNSLQNYLTDVGAFTNSASAYGTYDQGGDVFQWNDAVLGSSRDLRGGSWVTAVTGLKSSSRLLTPSDAGANIGFRVATVPEPSTWAMLVAGTASLLALRRRKRE